MKRTRLSTGRARLALSALIGAGVLLLGIGVAAAALSSIASGNDAVNPAGDVFEVTASGPFEGGAILAVTTCGNAATDGTPYTQAEVDAFGADHCWGATELGSLNDPANATMASAFLGPVDGTDYTFVYTWVNDGIGIEDSTCVTGGEVDCLILVTLLDGDQNPIGDPIEHVVTLDADNDGVGDDTDNCPSASNADQTNTDGLDDGGDACDDDDDEDGVVDGSDNCRVDANPDQTDEDEDGLGAACDDDDTVAVVSLMCDFTPAPFTDVADTSFAKDSIACLYNIDVLTGIGGGLYGPDLDVTREQVATVLARMYKAMTGDDAPIVATPFTDVNADSYGADSIARIYGLGLTTGTSATTFGPNDHVTREQLATFIARFYKLIKGEDAPIVATPFTDVNADSFGADSIARIFGLEITTGTSDTTFSPDAYVSRDQLATFMARTYVA